MASTGEAVHSMRRPELDGLRGIAALVVVIHHALLTDIGWLSIYFGAGEPGTLRWWASETPFRLLWAGDVAVALFFVLSGYVVTRPFVSVTRAGWGSYYPRRLIRLYVPVWAALVFAVLLMFAVPRSSGGNPWLEAQAVDPTLGRVVAGAGLMETSPILGQLWSLKWEVLFSLLLPAFVVAARLSARIPVAVTFAPLAWLVYWSWSTGHEWGVYLPVFAFGAILAGRDVLGNRRELPTWTPPLLAVASLMAMTAHAYAVVAVGAAGFLGAVMRSRHLATAFSGRGLRWLGKISFSLYLVHIPVVLAVASWSTPLVVAVPLAAGTSLVAAVVFHRYVEEPTQRAAKGFGLRPVLPQATGTRGPAVST